MPAKITHFSRVSTGLYPSDQTLPAKEAGDTGAVFSADGPVTLGFGGTTLDGISATTASVNFGAVSPHDSSSLTVGLSGAAVGDTVVVNPDSAWSGAYYDLALNAHVSAADVVTISAVNSTLTSVNPDAVTMRIAAINFGSFV
ncbi:MAG: hypothetical protein R3268_00785 [Acidiferrobacterales bacterium]|nr:hypothetical protein [Acidiferrobacterales bacterium]